VICLIAVDRFNLPAPTGSFAVGTTILTLTDPTRSESHDPATHRTVVVQLWYPAAPSSNPIARYQRWSETTLSTFYIRPHAISRAPLRPTLGW
jgi:hypothetical protein